MSRTGELVQWNNKGGYGFVRDGTGNDFYVHISKLAEGEPRPKPGDQLRFDIATGRNGRPAAINIVVAAAAPVPERSMRDVRRLSDGVPRYQIGLRTTAATMLTLLILLAIATDRAPLWLGTIYTLMGLASALLYRFDKLYALNDRWRVSEANLHVVDFCFGIIGGLIAQEIYRHKTVKPRFVAVTWALALIHVLGLAMLALGWVSIALP